MQSSILLEIQYLAPVQYYSKLLQYDTIYLEQYENYSKGSYRNRCYIATANGVLCLSIPLVKGKHQQTGIRAVRIDYSQDWQQVHWRSILTAYGSAPYFDYYKSNIQPFYEKKYDLLFNFVIDFQKVMLDLLKMKVNIEYTKDFERQPAAEIFDARNQILPKYRQQAAERDQQFTASYYPQLFEDRHGFIPNLSILDLLFCTGPEALYYLQQSIVK